MMLSTAHVWLYLYKGAPSCEVPRQQSKHGITLSDHFDRSNSFQQESALEDDASAWLKTLFNTNLPIFCFQVSHGEHFHQNWKVTTTWTWLNPWNLGHLEEPCWPWSFEWHPRIWFFAPFSWWSCCCACLPMAVGSLACHLADFYRSWALMHSGKDCDIG